MYQCLRSSKVSRYGNVVHIAKPEQISLTWLVRLCRDRISEKQQKVYLIAGDPRSYLLISSLRAAEITLNG